MRSGKPLGQTVGASVVCVVTYLFMIYLATPILDITMTWFGTYFVPERYGGGASAAEPGLITLIIRGMIQNWISAYCAIKASVTVFSNSNKRSVAVVLGLFAAFGTIMFTLVLMKKDGIIALIIPVIIAPTMYLAYQLWKEEEIFKKSAAKAVGGNAEKEDSSPRGAGRAATSSVFSSSIDLRLLLFLIGIAAYVSVIAYNNHAARQSQPAPPAASKVDHQQAPGAGTGAKVDWNKELAAAALAPTQSAVPETAPEKENAQSLTRRGLLYYKGEGVHQDYAEAARLFFLAAGQGYADAQYCLGLMYFSGLSLPQDYAEAVRMFRLAADQGTAQAQNALGMMYRDGAGVPSDTTKAAKWFRMAAAQGSKEAQVALNRLQNPPEGAHEKLDPAQAAIDAKVTFTGIKKADQTVGEIYKWQDGLGGSEVRVRGKVVKFTAQIMGTNWVHVQDGTGQTGGNDLTVTTADTAQIGDTVLVTGKITLKKDFGMGYKYDLIIEDGRVKVE